MPGQGVEFLTPSRDPKTHPKHTHPKHTAVMRWLLCLSAVLSLYAACAGASTPRIAVIGGGVGGTAAAYFLRQQNPSWHIELFERDGRLGGRTQELRLDDGRVLELGASIIHGANKYMLSLARSMNLTLSSGDDTGAAFSIWDGSSFVFSQTDRMLSDLWAIAKRYGVTPLRYKWLSEEAGRRFGLIYALQQQGTAFETPEEWLQQLDLYNMTQQSAADYMKEQLLQGWFSHGAGQFIEELAAAVNRINYNQRNEQLNALAGLVSYLPAAQPEVYSIKEGNAALPQKLTEAADLQGLHLDAAVRDITRDATGDFYYLSVQPVQSPPQPRAAQFAPGGHQSRQPPAQQRQDRQQRKQQQHEEEEKTSQQAQQHGPYDAVIIATPLEGSGMKLRGLDAKPVLPPRVYQATTTSFVAGFLDASFFNRRSLPPGGDVFVTNSADTPFTVVSSKGCIDAATVHQAAAATLQGSSVASTSKAAGWVPSKQQGQQQQQQQQLLLCGQLESEQLPLWKVFSDEPLSWHTLRTLFVNGTVMSSKPWSAYPRFQAPEKFAPFWLAPGLCYNNALENAASAMEVAAVAAKNCMLLVQQHLRRQAARRATSVV